MSRSTKTGILGTSICRLSTGGGERCRLLPLCLGEVHGKPEECRRKRQAPEILF